MVPGVFLALLACQDATSPAGPPSTAPHATQPFSFDTAAVYRTAIADYILAMDSVGVPLPDTVNIGRHPEFPAIELSGRIAQRTIRLIDPSVGEQEKDRSRFAYLNIFSTYSPGRAQFYVVRFAQGLSHRPDGSEDRHLYYRVNEQQEMVLEHVSR